MGDAETPLTPAPGSRQPVRRQELARSLSVDNRSKASAGQQLDWTTFDEKHGTFTVKLLSPPSKKRKRRGSAQSAQQQEDPLEGVSDVGPLPTIVYAVQPAAFWEGAPRYKRFSFDGVSFSLGDIVFVKNDETPAQRALSKNAPIVDWMAKILEIRAAAESRTYLRVYWIYRPEDLLDGGRQPYHGRNEVIPSNDMGIIAAGAVNGKTTLNYWKETDEEEEFDPDQLFWRQTYNNLYGSDLRTYCIDEKPYNPDTLLVHCPTCNKWLHGPCIEAAAVKRACETHASKSPEAPRTSSRRKKSTPKSRKSTGAIQQADANFKAEVQISLDKKTKIILTGTRDGSEKTTEEPVRCLFEDCGALIE